MRIEKMEKLLTKISCMFQFIDIARFIASLLSNLINNLSEWIHRIEFKYENDDKKCEMCTIKYTYCYYFLEYTNMKDDLIEYKCLCCNKNDEHKFIEKLK